MDALTGTECKINPNKSQCPLQNQSIARPFNGMESDNVEFSTEAFQPEDGQISVDALCVEKQSQQSSLSSRNAGQPRSPNEILVDELQDDVAITNVDTYLKIVHSEAGVDQPHQQRRGSWLKKFYKGKAIQSATPPCANASAVDVETGQDACIYAVECTVVSRSMEKEHSGIQGGDESTGHPFFRHSDLRMIPEQTPDKQSRIATVDNYDAYHPVSTTQSPKSRMWFTSKMQGQSAVQAFSSSKKSVVSQAKQSLQSARLGMEDGFDEASKCFNAGRSMIQSIGKLILSASLKIALAFAILALVILATALCSLCWRIHEYKYVDRNGHNTVFIHLGLSQLQRVQKLERNSHVGTVYIYDTPQTYSKLAQSATCTPSDKNIGASIFNQDEANDMFSKAALRRLATQHDQDGNVSDVSHDDLEVSQISADANHSPRDPRALDFEGRASDTSGGSYNATDSLGEALQSYRLTIGRDPAAAGGISGSLLESRKHLLGHTVNEVNCKDLLAFEKGGDTYIQLAVFLLLFLSLGIVLLILTLVFMEHKHPRCGCSGSNYTHGLALVCITMSCVLEGCSLGVWGAYTDVAACVSAQGGAVVCPLGAASLLSIVALVFQVAAITFYVLFLFKKRSDVLAAEKRSHDNHTEKIVSRKSTNSEIIAMEMHDEEQHISIDSSKNFHHGTQPS